MATRRSRSHCGPSALTKESGELCPIQWTGFDPTMKRYQGEPLAKEGIKRRFFEILERSADPMNNVELTSIKLVLEAIMRVEWA